MINTNIYNYINVLDQAAEAANTRNEILANNIANVDTPNYKRKEVAFESYLEHALVGGEPLDIRVAEVNADWPKFDGVIYTDNSDLAYRLDGNNVDIDTESAYLAENQIRYNTLVEQIGQEFNRYKTVLTG